MNTPGNNRYCNIIQCSVSKGAVLFESAFVNLNNFYISGNIGPSSGNLGNGKGFFINCIFDNNNILTEPGCSSCSSCIYNTLFNTKYLLIHLNTKFCEGIIINKFFILKKNIIFYLFILKIFQEF